MNARGESGYVVVTVALLALLLLGAAALAVDVGVFYSTRTSAQQIADSAALGGAFTFVINPTGPQPDTARQYAEEIATGQAIRGGPILSSEVSVAVDVANQLVTVDISRDEGTFFGRALAIDQASIQVQASAEAAQTATGSGCTKPWFLPNTVLLPPGTSPCDTCPGSPSYDPALADQLLISPSSGHMTAFAQAARGTQISVAAQNPEVALVPGQFYAIQLGNGAGAAVYEDNIAQCAPGGVYCGECYTAETGNMVGPTIFGVERLTGTPADTFNEASFCYDPGCRDTSPSLVVVPVWDVCAQDTGACPATDFCPDGRLTGTTVSFRVVGFALVFVEGVQGPNVSARLIDVKTCAGSSGGGGGSGGSGGGEVGKFGVPVRLVQTPQ